MAFEINSPELRLASPETIVIVMGIFVREGLRQMFSNGVSSMA